MDDYKIRRATLSDLDTLLEFEQGVIEAERPYDPTIPNNKVQYYDLKELIESEDAEVVVIDDGEKLIASGYAKKKRARHYLDHEYLSYLGFMYTHPDYRGQGLNAKIIEVLKEWSYAKGFTEIQLTVYDDNEAAIKAYEKVGFKKHIIEMRIV